MKRQMLFAVVCAALLGFGCDDGGGGTDSGPTPGTDSGPTGTDSGPTPGTDSGPVATDGFARNRAAGDRVNAAFCACYFADDGFESASACEAFGDLTEADACEDTANTASGTAAYASFNCIASVFEAYATCLEAASCDDTAIADCFDTASSAASGCPDAPSAYTTPYTECIAANVVGATASTCPENGTASSATGASVFTGTTLTAGNDQVDSDCGGEEGADRVYQWTAPSTGYWVIDTDGSSFDTVLSVLDGCTDGTELECNDDADEEDIGYRSRLGLMVESGTTIFIVVDGYDAEAAGSFVVNINAGTAPTDGGTGGTDAGTGGTDAGTGGTDAGTGGTDAGA